MFITKTGFRATKWDSDLREHVDDPITNILHYIRQSCTIEDGVTLKDIIHHIAVNPDLKDLVENYAWCDVDAFWKQVQKPCVKKSTLHYIVLNRFITIQKELKNKKTGEVYTKEGEVEQSIHVNGVGPAENTSHGYAVGEIVNNWAIEMTDVSEMADTPVKLGGVVIRDERTLDENNQYKEITSSDAESFSLLEVLGEIMWELSFVGSPSDVAAMSLDLHQMVEDIKSGKATTTPLKLSDLDDDDEVKTVQ